MTCCDEREHDDIDPARGFCLGIILAVIGWCAIGCLAWLWLHH